MKTSVLSFFVVAVFLAVSCQSPTGSNSNGTLTLSLPAPRSATGTGTSYGTQARVQLVRNGAVVPLSGQSYLQQSLAGQTITVTGLPTGSGFILNLSTGDMNGQYFQVAYNQTSSPFEISAGNTTTVTVTLKPTPVTLVESGTGAHSTTIDAAGNLYYLQGKGLEMVPAGKSPTTTPTMLSSNYLGTTGVGSVNNLGYDPTQSALYLDTDLGIASMTTGAGAFTNTTMVSTSGAQINPVFINNSAAAVLNYQGTNYPFAAYWGTGTISGILFNSGTKWNTLTDMLSLSSTLANRLAKSPHVIGAFSTTPQFLYLSTSIGVYRVSGKLLSTMTGSSASQASDLGKTLSDGTDSDGSVVLSFTDSSVVGGPVSAFSDQSSKALVFVGTGNGLFSGAVDPSLGIPKGGTSTNPEPLNRVPGTFGLQITSLATSPYTPTSGTVYTAAYSAGTGEVLLLQDQTLVSRLSASAGLPAGTPKFTWYNTGTPGSDILYLVISGTDSTVSYQAATW